MLVMYEFIECDFEDDFGFHKCLIHTYDMRHILNMNHVQCFNHIISPLIHFVLLDLFTKEENLPNEWNDTNESLIDISFWNIFLMWCWYFEMPIGIHDMR